MAGVLVGRSDELALIGAFAERARTGGEALLLFAGHRREPTGPPASCAPPGGTAPTPFHETAHR